MSVRPQLDAAHAVCVGPKHQLGNFTVQGQPLFGKGGKRALFLVWVQGLIVLGPGCDIVVQRGNDPILVEEHRQCKGVCLLPADYGCIPTAYCGHIVMGLGEDNIATGH